MKNHTYRVRVPAPRQQKGAVLIVSLVFLLILTTLAVTNMREVALESRTTGNLVNERACLNAAEAGLRDGQYLLTGPLIPNAPGNYPFIPLSYIDGEAGLGGQDALLSCPEDLPANQPCVIRPPNPDEGEKKVFTQAFAPGDPNYAGVKRYSRRDLTEFDQDIVWYAIPFVDGDEEAMSENPEYGNPAAGIGSARFEINTSASDGNCRMDLRSTTLRINF